MIGLLLFYTTLLGLLYLVFRLFQKLFKTYDEVDFEALNHSNKTYQEVKSKSSANEECHQFIENRLVELNEHFSDEQKTHEKSEEFSSGFKRLMDSSFHLLKKQCGLASED